MSKIVTTYKVTNHEFGSMVITLWDDIPVRRQTFKENYYGGNIEDFCASSQCTSNVNLFDGINKALGIVIEDDSRIERFRKQIKEIDERRYIL